MPEVRSIVIVGGGGHAGVVAEAAVLSGVGVLGFLDDDPHATLGDSLERLGGLDLLADLDPLEASLMLGLGDLGLRRRLIPAMRGPAASIVHPRAFVAPSADIHEGAWVGPGAVVHTRATVGAHAIVNSGAILEHDVILGENVHVAPGAALGGGARIDDDALVGLGARLIPGVRVGAGAIVGAGAVVLEDVPGGATVVGAPARRVS